MEVGAQKSWTLLSHQPGTLNCEAYASLPFIRPPMAPLMAYGTYGLWHQLWLFTCGVTLVETMVLYFCMFRNNPFGNTTWRNWSRSGEGREGCSELPHPTSLTFSCDTNPTRDTSPWLTDKSSRVECLKSLLLITSSSDNYNYQSTSTLIIYSEYWSSDNQMKHVKTFIFAWDHLNHWKSLTTVAPFQRVEKLTI